MRATARQTELLLDADSRDLKELVDEMTSEINHDVQAR